MKPKVFIVGVGLTQFYKPDNHTFDYHELAADAIK